MKPSMMIIISTHVIEKEISTVFTFSGRVNCNSQYVTEYYYLWSNEEWRKNQIKLKSTRGKKKKIAKIYYLWSDFPISDGQL